MSSLTSNAVSIPDFEIGAFGVDILVQIQDDTLADTVLRCYPQASFLVIGIRDRIPHPTWRVCPRQRRPRWSNLIYSRPLAKASGR